MTHLTEALVFGTADGVELCGDLYRPEGDGPHPVLVAAPGGAWLRGHRRDLRYWGEHLAAAGFAVFVADYRRATRGAVFPHNARDLAAAVRFVGTNAARFDLDPERLGLLGASAGAHLAALVALAGDPAPQGMTADPLPIVRVLVGVYGVYDLFSHWQADLSRNSPPGQDHTVRMLGAEPYADQRLYFEASPIRHVSYARADLKVLLVYGDADTAVLPDQSRSFAQALTQARCLVHTVVVPGAGHFWFSDEPIDMPTGHCAHVAPRLVRFLQRHLAGLS